MFQRSRGKHRKPRVRWVGPFFALDMALAQLSALREASEVTRAQLAEIAGQR